MGEEREGNKNTKSYNREEKIEMIFPIIFDRSCTIYHNVRGKCMEWTVGEQRMYGNNIEIANAC